MGILRLCNLKTQKFQTEAKYGNKILNMTIAQIIHELETWAPLWLQEDYDNAGLLTGDKNTTVKNVLVSLDCTEAVIDEAIEHKCELIVCHHPVIFGGLKKLTGENYVQRTVIKAIKNNIAIYAIHTNLDNVANGVNKIICEKLKLTQTRILQPKTNQLCKLVVFVPREHADKVRLAMFNAGAGNIGNYSECSFNTLGEGTFKGSDATNPFVGEKNQQHKEVEIKIEVIVPNHATRLVIEAMISAHPYEEVAYDIYPLTNTWSQVGSGMTGELANHEDEKAFLQRVKNTFHAGAVRHTALLGKPVKTVAVCGGSGQFLLKSAISAGAQVFITSDFKYHQFFDAEGKVLIADIGHFESERFTIDLIGGFLKEKFNTFAVRLSGVDTNPVKYL
jgi:dinuclear metal center YbgI/SA1388 family protein